MQLIDAVQLIDAYGKTGDQQHAPDARKPLARWLGEEKPSLEVLSATARPFVE